MNKLSLYSFTIASIAAFASCEEDVSYNVFKDPSNIEFKIVESSVEFKGNATKPQVITVQSALFPSVTYSGNFRISNILDYSGKNEFKYEILPYATLKDTTYQVTFKAGNEEKNATIHLSPAAPGFLGLGWNLGNHFDTSDMTYGYWDQSTPTADLYTGLAALGFNSVRIPATWTNHMDADNKIDPLYMDEIAKNVDFAIAAGLNVVLNTHHDCFEDSLSWATNSPEDSAKVAHLIDTLWTQIAVHFANQGEKLMFETFNELHNGDDWSGSDEFYAITNQWNQIAVNAIRKAGGNNATRWIGIPGFAANAGLAIKSLKLPVDPANKLAVSVHCYDPYNFCIEGKSMAWGTNNADQAAIDQYMFDITDTFLNNGIPVYIGEFGCVTREDPKEEQYRLDYLKAFTNAARTYGLSCFLWDNFANKQSDGTVGGKECHFFVNHNDGTPADGVAQEAINAIVDGYKNK